MPSAANSRRGSRIGVTNELTARRRKGVGRSCRKVYSLILSRSFLLNCRGPLEGDLMPPFSRSLVESGQRTMIESRCPVCGETQIVSAYDGSLMEWEQTHADECHTAEQGRGIAPKAVSR